LLDCREEKIHGRSALSTMLERRYLWEKLRRSFDLSCFR
jgi:hypothetical protein